MEFVGVLDQHPTVQAEVFLLQSDWYRGRLTQRASFLEDPSG